MKDKIIASIEGLQNQKKQHFLLAVSGGIDSMVMLDFFNSRYVSLGCSVINGVFAVTLLVDQSWILAGICVLASGYCFGNYIKAKKDE